MSARGEQGVLDFAGAAAPGGRAPIGVGDEVWCFLEERVGDNDKGKNRAILRGAARARVVAIVGDRLDLVVLASSPDSFIGRELQLGRGAVWSCRDRAEHRAFGAEVARFWPAKGERR